MEESELNFIGGLLKRFQLRKFNHGESFMMDDIDFGIYDELRVYYEGSISDLSSLLGEAMVEMGWAERYDIFLITTKKWGCCYGVDD